MFQIFVSLIIVAVIRAVVEGSLVRIKRLLKALIIGSISFALAFCANRAEEVVPFGMGALVALFSGFAAALSAIVLVYALIMTIMAAEATLRKDTNHAKL